MSEVAPREVTGARILELLDDPEELEALYREVPESFRHALEEACQREPDAVVLRAWRARLGYEARGGGTAWRSRLWRAIGIAVACGALVRLPAVWLGEEWYYPRFGPMWVLLALSCYFWMEHRDRRHLVAALGLLLASGAYVSLPSEYSDSVVMALIHLPIVFWVLLGVAFTGARWRETEARIRFVRYNGELLILASLVALGGFVFSAVTVSLFELVGEGIDEWYAQNIGVVGAAAVPVAATYLYDAVFNRRTGIAAVLARVFTPLFLVMSVIYLVVALGGGQNPFTDRDFLITFNGLLLLVLGMTGFSIAERGQGARAGPSDYVNLALLAVTVVIDAIALSAIVFRTASFGFTPNRVVVLGANVIIMVHLAWMGWAYLALLRTGSGFGPLRRIVVRYLPVYGVWAAVVVFVLPLVFRFG